MRIILSRKGFDSTHTAGGAPSPAYEDGSLVSLPIPEPRPSASSLGYDDIDAGGIPLGCIVEGLTNGQTPRSKLAHLDPDLRAEARPRPTGWRPLFGQAGAAIGHLAKRGVGPGDLFLFFGWFRYAENRLGEHSFRVDACDRHVMFGWLQVGSVYNIGSGETPERWMSAHPHSFGTYDSPNAQYVARERMELAGVTMELPGGGVFGQLAPELVLTACDHDGVPQVRRSKWRLPRCFLPDDGPGLSYHSNPSR